MPPETIVTGRASISPREVFHELGAVTDVGRIGQPNHLDVARVGQESV